MRGLSPGVARPLNRAAAAALDAASSGVATLRLVATAVETWLDEHSEIYETRADVDDPELIDELVEEEDE